MAAFRGSANPVYRSPLYPGRRTTCAGSSQQRRRRFVQYGDVYKYRVGVLKFADVDKPPLAGAIVKKGTIMLARLNKSNTISASCRQLLPVTLLASNTETAPLF